jgi:AcrR family transcriptional regulator
MGKGEQTRQAILDEAFSLASCIGVGALSIGVLAERTRMSKSGLFAHFGSKEELQLAVLRESQLRFGEAVVRPALREPRGLPRLRAMLANWLDWTRAVNSAGWLRHQCRSGGVRRSTRPTARRSTQGPDCIT